MKDTQLVDKNSPTEIIFDQGGEVVVYDATDTLDVIERKIIVSNNTRLRWYVIIFGMCKYMLHFETQSGETIIRALLLAKAEEKLDVTIHSALTDSHTVTNIHILSLVGDTGNIALNGTVQIGAGIEKVKGHILEENIFLGEKGNIRGIPSLLVHSDDVEAGHAARIERIPDEKLYYLRARGIPRDDASVMMIRSSVASVFEGLDDEYQEKILEQVMSLF